MHSFRFSNIAVLSFALVYTSACINAKKVHKTDRRSHSGEDANPDPDGKDISDSPGNDGNPSSDPENGSEGATPASPQPEDNSFLLPDGAYQFQRVSCNDGSTETLDAIWVYDQKAGQASLTRKSTGGCLTIQETKVEASDRKAVLTPGESRCEGACSGDCEKLFTDSSQFILAVEPGPSSVLLKPGLPFIRSFCEGKQPAVIDIAPKNANTCEKHWTSDFGNGSMQVFEGLLRWDIPAVRKLQTHDIVSTATLTGDFTVEVTYKGLEVVGRGAYFKVLLKDLDDPKYQAYVLAGNYSAAKGEANIHQAAIVTDGNFIDPPAATIENRSKVDGKIVIEKRGTKVTASGMAEGDPTASRSSTDEKPFSNNKYQVILEIGSNSNLADVTEVTSVNIDAVIVKDGSGKELSATDTFDCQSIK